MTDASPEPEMDLELEVKANPAAILEERRRARAAILAKYSAAASGTASLAQSSRENTPFTGDGVSVLNSPAQRLTVDSPHPGDTLGGSDPGGASYQSRSKPIVLY